MDLGIIILIILWLALSGKNRKNIKNTRKQEPVRRKNQSGLFTEQEISRAAAAKSKVQEDLPEGVSSEGEDPCHPASCAEEKQTEAEAEDQEEEDAYGDKNSNPFPDEAGDDVLKGIIWSEILKRKY